MSVLEGDLTDFQLPDVLRLLSFTSKTGRLTLEDGTTRGRIDLVDGRVRDASADASRVPIARRLLGVGLGRIEQVVAAFEANGTELPTDLELARHLAGTPDADVAALSEVAREQTLDAVFDLLRWSSGAFKFEPGDATPRGPSALDLAVTVDDLLAETSRRLEEWSSLADTTGDLAAIVSVRRPAGDDRVEVALTPDGWTLLSLVDGRRTLADLVALTGQGEYRTRCTVRSLLDEGVLAVGDTGDAGPVERLLRDHATLSGVERRHRGSAAPVDAGATAATADAATDPQSAAPRTGAPAPTPRVAPAPTAEVRKLRTRVRGDRLETDPNVDEDLVSRLIEGVEGL